MASKHPLESPELDQAPASKRYRPKEKEASFRQDPNRAAVRVELNPADCDLDFNIDKHGLQGHALHEEGFAYCWSGARATVGITGGKYCFGCKVISDQEVDMADTPPDQQHICRVGISRGDEPVGSLGETIKSFGFGGTGKFSNGGKFSDYGSRFGVGDTIICTVDLEKKPLPSIGFSKNGKSLGVAMHFDASSIGIGASAMPPGSRPWESAFFPHVLLKNVVVQLQVNIEDGLIPEEGYKPWAAAFEDGNAVVGPSFTSPSTCEVIMMVGLPASGKTTWAEKWMTEHPEKRYVLLGTNLALDKMKVPGLMRKNNYGERFERLMDRATGIFNVLLSRAANTARNYILDQTNVYKSARNRKLRAFVDYRKIAVVIFPSQDELRLRAEQRFKEMGKDVPAEAVNEMIANYILPTTKNMPPSKELFDEVIFIESGREEAQRQLDDMKRALVSPSTGAKQDPPHYSCMGVNWPASTPSPPLYDSRSTFQVSSSYSSVYSSPSSFRDRQIIPDYTGLSTQRDNMYTSSHGANSSPHVRYSSPNFSSRLDSLGSSRRLEYENPTMPPLYRSPGVQFQDTRVPYVGHQSTGSWSPQYEFRSPAQSSYGLNYQSPPPRLPYRYPPNQMRPPSGQWYQ
ncbi:heterogeneous nuclear ribonucleoprotein U-like protein 1 isoform X4 [Zingiber officinale]|uniref:heterogeneous nuclear ribonucleoprotein U-like protein 1 isoform X4 n=1 Tax=Zingiber officinale TaxID=94328 RepID=UPI001C4DB4A1|nr:heterogeneous nuclear ribonucleoprotein U-like protein 1 isoform X4 [Zingiber officinale]